MALARWKEILMVPGKKQQEFAHKEDFGNYLAKEISQTLSFKSMILMAHFMENMSFNLAVTKCAVLLRKHNIKKQILFHLLNLLQQQMKILPQKQTKLNPLMQQQKKLPLPIAFKRIFSILEVNVFLSVKCPKRC